MTYKPGSFSKNFAFHGTGLKKLHDFIRKGFHNTLTPVKRDEFRKVINNSPLDLLPVNFYLHNKEGLLSVDEIVYQAITKKHSVRFDYLALFALNLSRVGSSHPVNPRPAMWANKFVRERLWADDSWHAEALSIDALDKCFADKMDATQGVRVKCRSNYRHIYELCGYLPSKIDVINSHTSQFLDSAVFLLWDRWRLDEKATTKAALLDALSKDEAHKLLGVGETFLMDHANQLADIYENVGGLQRFNTMANTNAPTKNQNTPAKPAKKIDLSLLLQEGSDQMVERRVAKRREQKRDSRLAAALKQTYNNACQFCGECLQVSEDRFYSEAAHIKALGKPHNGPDKLGNMLVLCPNHHLQFDGGMLTLRKKGSEYIIKSKSSSHPLNGAKINLQHDLLNGCVKYHRNWCNT